MDNESKSTIKRQYKEQQQAKGIYCIRCNEAATIWVDSSKNIKGSENRLNFTLKTGSPLNVDLLQALKVFGPGSFEFEVLEIFEDDLSAYDLGKLLKERRKYWQQSLSAKSLHN